jgi:hypothetical protein
MSLSAMAQNVMSPETLWKLGRVSALGISKDSKNVVYKVTSFYWRKQIQFKILCHSCERRLPNRSSGNKGSTKGQNISWRKYLVYSEEVKINDVLGKDFYLI